MLPAMTEDEKVDIGKCLSFLRLQTPILPKYDIETGTEYSDSKERYKARHRGWYHSVEQKIKALLD